MFTLILWTIFFVALAKVLATLHTSITPNVLYFLGGLALVYFVSKYYEFRHNKEVPKINSDLSNAPPDYQEYLKYKALASKYEKTEPVTIQKFLLGFTQGKNWAKSIIIGVMFLIMAFVGYGIFKEVTGFFNKPIPPVVSTITNTGAGKVDSKTESNQENKQSNGLNLGIFNNWF